MYVCETGRDQREDAPRVSCVLRSLIEKLAAQEDEEGVGSTTRAPAGLALFTDANSAAGGLDLGPYAQLPNCCSA